MKDPVCDMEVEPRVTLGSSCYQGETYCFTNVTCKALFDRDPGKYPGLPAEDRNSAERKTWKKGFWSRLFGVSAAGEKRVPAN